MLTSINQFCISISSLLALIALHFQFTLLSKALYNDQTLTGIRVTVIPFIHSLCAYFETEYGGSRCSVLISVQYCLKYRVRDGPVTGRCDERLKLFGPGIGKMLSKVELISLGQTSGTDRRQF